jgi:hypothetical protein
LERTNARGTETVLWLPVPPRRETAVEDGVLMMTKRAWWCFFGLFFTSLVACTSGEKRPTVTEERVSKMQGESAKEEKMQDESAKEEKWFGFTPYPGARKLCEQAVDGWSSTGPVGFVWRSYATRDATAQVIAFYAKAEGRNAEVEGKSLIVRRGQKKVERVLSVHAASATDYPSCDSKPRPGEKTVIIVSD